MRAYKNVTPKIWKQDRMWVGEAELPEGWVYFEGRSQDSAFESFKRAVDEGLKRR